MKRGLCRAGAAWIVALATVVAATAAQATDLHVRWADGRRAAPIPVERLSADSDEWYVSADALADALSIERFWRPEARKLVLKVGNRRIQVTIATRLVLDGDDEILLREPVLYRRGSVMLPLEFIERVLAQRLGEGARLDRRTLDLVLGRSAGDITAIEYEPGPDGTRIRVRLARAFDYRAQATSRQLVRLRLEGAEIDPVALAADRPAPLVRSVRAEQAGRVAVLYIELEGSAGFADRREDGGRSVVIDVQRGTESPPPPPMSARTPLLQRTAAAPDSFDVIVLDPGHGGFDRGARVAGIDEPDVTLRIATALRPILERELGMRVVLTRDGNVTLSAASRAEIANRAGGDVLVSLHCNTWFDSHARGFEVLYPPQTRSTAADAALASNRRGITDFIPWQVAHAPWAAESRAFADELATALAHELGAGRGARSADLEVLHGATMPAVVVEMGFLTNTDDRAVLVSEEFPARFGAALVTAIRSLRRSAEGGRR